MKITKPEKTPFKDLYAIRVELPSSDQYVYNVQEVPKFRDKTYIDLFIEKKSKIYGGK